MNKITRKPNVLFTTYRLRKIYEHKPMSNKELTTIINNKNREYKENYNKYIKHKLGKRKNNG